MKIDALTVMEQQLRSRVNSVEGLMEEKHEKLQRSGVYREYGRIYEAYVELIESESEGLEALKRAVFLCWYHSTEPSCFSGILDLPEITSLKVFEALERRIEAGELDSELKWMLPYYNTVENAVFSLYARLPHTQSFLAEANPDIWPRVGIKVEQFMNRGRMGDYWESIIKTQAKNRLSR